jgi:hypothetical protein
LRELFTQVMLLVLQQQQRSLALRWLYRNIRFEAFP